MVGPEEDDGSEAEDDGRNPDRPDGPGEVDEVPRGAVALPLGAGLLAATGVGLVVSAREWLEIRTWWAVGLVVLAVLVAGAVSFGGRPGRSPAAGPDRPRSGPATAMRAAWGVAIVCVLIAAVVIGTDLRRPPLSEFTHRSDPENVSEVGVGVDARLLGDDLPPVAAYGATLTLVLLALVFVRCAAVSREGRPGCWRRWVRQATGRVVGGEAAVGVMVTVALVAGAIGTGVGARTIADRTAEDVSVTSQQRRVHRTDATTLEGPDVDPGTEASDRGTPGALEQRWERTLPDVGSPGDHRSVAAVPGWDAIVVFTRPESYSWAAGQLADGSQVSVYTARDGSLAWSYTQRRGGIGGVAVDPLAGRVLIMVGQAAVVLRLDDGQEVATHRAPSPGVSWEWVLVPPEGVFYGDSYLPPLTIGETAVMQPNLLSDTSESPGLAVLEVATGEVVASAPPPSYGCLYAAATSGTMPAVLEWGEAGTCGTPTLLLPDGSGNLEPVVEIEPPDGVIPACDFGCTELELLVDGETVVASLTWDREPGDGQGSLEHVYDVAIITEGELRGRASTAMNINRRPIDEEADLTDPSVPTEVAAVTDVGVVGYWFGRAHLLSLDDGTELVSPPSDTVGSGDRWGLEVEAGDRPRGFSVLGDELVVIDVGNLTESFRYDLDPDDDLDLPEDPQVLLMPRVDTGDEVAGVQNMLVINDQTTIRAFS